MDNLPDKLSVIVVGASGDLAHKKIYPALFALYCQGYLPDDFNVFGFSRSTFTHDAFRESIMQHLTCRYVPGESCADRMNEFLSRCFYQQGSYDSPDSFLDLFQLMHERESVRDMNRLFYLAIPPSVFLDVARSIGDAGLVQCTRREPWSRVVIEKPFGHDRGSSDDLTEKLGHVFSENQTYRIDHYLGKEMIQNLLVLRFANLVFEPIWNREHIRNVQIVWKEDLSVEGRGGYFDDYGIVRDVMQNHLLQMLSLVAMEHPAGLGAHAIRDAKVDVLKHIPPVERDHIAVGQYTAGEHKGRTQGGYTDDKTVPDDSRTPTLGAAVIHIDNDRWREVPFLVLAGKGMDNRLTEIRIRFNEVPANMFCKQGACPEPNELVIRVQPDEAVSFTVNNKVPGLGMKLDTRHLDLTYKAAFAEEIPDAYESLLLDVMRGEKSLFIRSDELAAAWDVFTPILRQLDDERIVPEPYAFGTKGPPSVHKLAEDHNVKWI